MSLVKAVRGVPVPSNPLHMKLATYWGACLLSIKWQCGQWHRCRDAGKLPRSPARGKWGGDQEMHNLFSFSSS